MSSIASYIAISSKQTLKGEDRAASSVLENNVVYCAVYDGHNGSSAADWCAENMHIIIANLYRKGGSTVSVLKSAFLHAHSCISDSSGTTATVILLHGMYAAIAHIGDSRAILCHRGKAVTVTEDHRLDSASEHERIRDVERSTDRFLITGNRVDGLMVTRSIGDLPLSDAILPHPIINEFVRTIDDEYLILATDGFWDVCNGSTAIDIVNRQKLTTVTDMADALVYYASQQYRVRQVRADDITCCVIDLRLVPV